MTRVATVPGEITILQLPERAVAGRAGKRGGVAAQLGHILSFLSHFYKLDFRLDGRRNMIGSVGGSSVCEVGQQLGDLLDGQLVIDGDIPQRIDRHVGKESLRRILHDSGAAAGFDCRQPRGAVIKIAAEHDPDDSRAIGPRGGAEQRIDGGPVAVFFGTMNNAHAPRLEQHMAIGGRDVDPAILNWRIVGGVARRQAARPLQQSRQQGRDILRNV